MSGTQKRELLTPEGAGRALYIDFEGQQDQAPVLLGCSRRPGDGPELRVWQAVTDPVFAPLAQADGIELLGLGDAVERILQRAEANERPIVAWSEHELRVVARFCPDKFARFSARFVNAHVFAKYWRNSLYERAAGPEVHTLAAYLAIIGHLVPDGAGRGDVGATIADVRTSLAKGRGLAGVPENRLRRWGLLREHNRHDCAGMRRVCIIATNEIARAQAAGGR